MLTGLAPWGSKVETVPSLSPSFWWLPLILAITQLVAVSLWSLHLSSHGRPHARVCVPKFSFYKDTGHWIRSALIQCDFILVMSAKILFPNRSPSQVPGERELWAGGHHLPRTEDKRSIREAFSVPVSLIGFATR